LHVLPHHVAVAVVVHEGRGSDIGTTLRAHAAT
jgi:hypothetical protein